MNYSYLFLLKMLPEGLKGTVPGAQYTQGLEAVDKAANLYFFFKTVSYALLTT